MDTTEHTPGPSRIFRLDEQTGLYRQLRQVEPSDTFQCGHRIPQLLLGAPDDLVLCEDHAIKAGFIW